MSDLEDVEKDYEIIDIVCEKPTEKSQRNNDLKSILPIVVLLAISIGLVYLNSTKAHPKIVVSTTSSTTLESTTTSAVKKTTTTSSTFFGTTTTSKPPADIAEYCRHRGFKTGYCTDSPFNCKNGNEKYIRGGEIYCLETHPNDNFVCCSYIMAETE
ncbi:MAG: hypothetical protein KKD39_00300 [Candidatus Altiarchaeota archaeon]|nr:hypothetical protein [Candidatus Altiarchaeota archaeon]